MYHPFVPHVFEFIQPDLGVEAAYLGSSHAGALGPALVHQRCRRLVKTPRRQTITLAQARLGVFSAVQMLSNAPSCTLSRAQLQNM